MNAHKARSARPRQFQKFHLVPNAAHLPSSLAPRSLFKVHRVGNFATLAVIGVVSWASGPSNTEGCGGLTGVTPLELYRGWIVETARKMGVRLPD